MTAGVLLNYDHESFPTNHVSRKLTKRGEAELRRLLYCAAQPARHYWRFDLYYQKQLEKRLSKTAAKVILARKLARIAFALMSNQETFIKQAQPAG